MDTSLTIDCWGEELVCDPRHAAFRPSVGDLLVADVHIGKSELFRREGLPIPPGDLERDLRLLTELVCDYAPRRLVVLGDMVHHRDGLSQPVLDRVEQWRPTLASELLLVRGNHERTVARLPPSWRADEVEAPHRVHGWAYAHEPDPSTPHLVCGHVHPACRVGGRTRGVRLPCFWSTDRHLMLPAFGQFTGGHTIRPAEGDVVVACAGGEALRVGTAAR